MYAAPTYLCGVDNASLYEIFIGAGGSIVASVDIFIFQDFLHDNAAIDTSIGGNQAQRV